jgi:hypothetical protein
VTYEVLYCICFTRVTQYLTRSIILVHYFKIQGLIVNIGEIFLRLIVMLPNIRHM